MLCISWNSTKEAEPVEEILTFIYIRYIWASLVAQLVKNPPSLQETQIQSLGGEDHLEKETATHSSILAWRIPWTKGPGGL